MSTVLWVLLFIVLGLIALVWSIVIIAIILLAIPIRYRFSAKYGGEEGTQLFVKASYLFGLVGIVSEHKDGEMQTKIRVAWRTLKNKDKPAAEKKAKVAVNAENFNISVTPDIVNITPADTAPEEKKKEPLREKLARYKEKYENIKAIANDIWTYPDRKLITSLTLRALKSMWRAIRPKHIKITGTIGLSDPANTAYIMAIYAIVAEFLQVQRWVRIAANFEAPVIQVNAYVKGSCSILRLLLPIIWLTIKRPIRKLIKILLFRKGRKK